MPLLKLRKTATSAAVAVTVALAGAGSLAAPISQSPPGAADGAALDVLLRPVPDGAGEIAAIEVTLSASGLPAPAAGKPLVGLPLVVNNVETVAATVRQVAAQDARGPLRLTASNAGTGPEESRVWLTDRPVEGAWTLHYVAPISGRVATRGAAPPLELRSEAGAFSGAGSTFLLLPDGGTRAGLSMRWDLAALPRGAQAISSLGPGDVKLSEPQPLGRLERSYFMAGAAGLYSAGPFFAAWQGQPPFEARSLMAWTGQLHTKYLSFFRPKTVQPYGVFLRHNPVNAGGGVGLAGSFVATFGPQTDPEELKLTLAHEMFHTFAPAIGNPAGLQSSWFSEGLAVFYERTLPLRFGQIGPEDFLKNLNFHAARYYSSVMAGVPNSEVAARFWADTRVRTLAYDRGSLYFAVVNDQMRKASKGRRSLDDLLLAMIARERAGRVLSNRDWEEELRRNLGEGAVADFRAMLGGRQPLPPSDAFGPCFRRTTRPLRRYELGFEPVVLTEPRRIVRGLVPGSEAEKAGLRNGDEIMRPVPQDGIQGNQSQLIRLQIQRKGQPSEISYLPRGETVQAWQWERVPTVPDARCAI